MALSTLPERLLAAAEARCDAVLASAVAFGFALRGVLIAAAEHRLDADEATVVGADLNNWYRQENPGVVRLLQARFSTVTAHPPGGTADLPLFLPDLRLDHLFFGLPDSWDAEYRLLEDRYGSDHTPLLGWVRMAGRAPGTRTVDRDR